MADPNAFLNGFTGMTSRLEDSRRNRLNELYMGNQEQRQSTLFQQQQADRQTSQQNAMATQDEAKRKEAGQRAFVIMQNLAEAPPEQFQQLADQAAADPAFQVLGVSRDQITPETAQMVLSKARMNAGVAPPEKPKQYTQENGPRGSVLQRDPVTGELKQVVGPDNSQPSAASANRVRTMTAQEVQQAGLPAGTSAQIDSNGKIDILNKREGLSAAEQKTVREAKMRMPRLEAALRRTDRLGAAVAKIAQNPMFNGGPADAKVLKYTKDGQELAAASAQLMPELQALTRVPGIGSQSDLEARLASLALPSLEVAPEVNARSQAELKAFVEDLKAAYQSLLSGDQPTQAPSSGGWSVKRIN